MLRDVWPSVDPAYQVVQHDLLSSGTGAGALFDEMATSGPSALLGRTQEESVQAGESQATPYEVQQMELGRQLYTPERAPITAEQFAPTPTTKMLSADEANAKYGVQGELTFDGPVREGVARLRHNWKQEEIERRDILERADSGVIPGVARGAAWFAGQAVDPLNIASSFIPVVGEARYAAWAERFGRYGARALRGAAEGAVGQGVLEPFTAAQYMDEGEDYTALTALMDIAFGTALGGGLHVGMGAMGDAFGRLKFRQRESMVRAAVAQLADKGEVRMEAATPPEVRGAAETTATSEAIARSEVSGTRVADAQGRPVLMHHGTTAEFADFDRAHAPEGFLFTSEGADAKTYAGESGGRVVHAYLDIKNPASQQQWLDALDEVGWTPATLPEARAKAAQLLEQRGFDGIKRGGGFADKPGADIWVAFRPEQIKQVRPSAGPAAAQRTTIETPTRRTEVTTEPGAAATAEEAPARIESGGRATPYRSGGPIDAPPDHATITREALAPGDTADAAISRAADATIAEKRVSDTLDVKRAEADLADTMADLERAKAAGAVNEEELAAAMDTADLDTAAQEQAAAFETAAACIGRGGSRTAPEPARQFTTAKGSTYEVHGDGTTTRNKAYRQEHGPKEQGSQPRSEATFYVTPEDGNKLGEFQTQGGDRKIIAPIGDGRWGVKYTSGKGAGGFERRTVVKPQTEPAIGLLPVEIWGGGKTVHFGNKITSVGAK